MKFDGRRLDRNARLAIEQQLYRNPATRKTMKRARPAFLDANGGILFENGDSVIKAVFPKERSIHEGNLTLLLSLTPATRGNVPMVYEVIDTASDHRLYVDHVIVMGRVQGQPLCRLVPDRQKALFTDLASPFARLHNALEDRYQNGGMIDMIIPRSIFHPDHLKARYQDLKQNSLGKLNAQEQERLGCVVSEALKRLDGENLIHGDPHPGNVIIGPNSEVTLLDFGNVCWGPPEADIRIYDAPRLDVYCELYSQVRKRGINPRMVTALDMLTCMAYAGNLSEADQIQLKDKLNYPHAYYGPNIPLGL
jgi:serine/threonine protein kinase